MTVCFVSTTAADQVQRGGWDAYLVNSGNGKACRLASDSLVDPNARWQRPHDAVHQRVHHHLVRQALEV